VEAQEALVAFTQALSLNELQQLGLAPADATLGWIPSEPEPISAPLQPFDLFNGGSDGLF